MRSGAVVAMALLVGAAFTAVMPVPPTGSERASSAPWPLPQELSWQYVVTCIGDDIPGELTALAYGSGGGDVTFAEETPATQEAEERIEGCINARRYEQRAAGFSYIDAYERSQLYEYYSAVTAPCLQQHDVTLAPLSRADFFVPDFRPWNPYTGMRDRPFDELVSLYRACPPIPEYLLSRHRP